MQSSYHTMINACIFCTLYKQAHLRASAKLAGIACPGAEPTVSKKSMMVNKSQKFPEHIANVWEIYGNVWKCMEMYICRLKRSWNTPKDQGLDGDLRWKTMAMVRIFPRCSLSIVTLKCFQTAISRFTTNIAIAVFFEHGVYSPKGMVHSCQYSFVYKDNDGQWTPYYPSFVRLFQTSPHAMLPTTWHK